MQQLPGALPPAKCPPLRSRWGPKVAPKPPDAQAVADATTLFSPYRLCPFGGLLVDKLSDKLYVVYYFYCFSYIFELLTKVNVNFSTKTYLINLCDKITGYLTNAGNRQK